MLYTLAHMNTLSERIRWVMLKYNLSQAALAKIAGVKQPSVNRWVNGFGAAIRADAAVSICRYFSLSPDWLISGRGNPQGVNLSSRPDVATTPSGLFVHTPWRISRREVCISVDVPLPALLG